MIHATWNKRDHIALAVSGGVDSMVLLDLLLKSYKDTYQSLTLLHVNHGLRAASLEEADFLKTYAGKHGLIIYTKELSLTPEDFSQESARSARYQFFFDVMKAHGIKQLLTAHHYDDDLETLMNQVFSRRPPLGIANMRVVDDVTLHRPLIYTRKIDIYTYAHKEDVTYFEDVSNEENDYTRNYIRNEVMPLIEQHTHMSTEGLRQLKADYADFYKICASRFESVDSRIDRQVLLNLTSFEQAFVLRKLSGDVYLSRDYINEIINVASSSAANVTFSTNACDLIIAYDEISSSISKKPISLKNITVSGQHIFNGYKINVEADILPLTVRTFEPGDKIHLNFGVKKVARIFIDGKVPKHLRNSIPIVENQSGEIIAVGTMYNIIDKKLLNIEEIKAHDIEK